jgi:hypothetical protein
MTPALDGGTPAGTPTNTGLGTTATILLLASQQLQDVTGKRWDQTAILIPYLNLGIIEIINLKPDAYVVPRDIALSAGAQQSLTAGDFSMIDAICNLTGTSPLVPGQAITNIDKVAMDNMLPNWMMFTPNATVSFVVTDPRDPLRFYVFPPQPSSSPANKIRVLNSGAPAEITETTDTFPLDDSYKPACVDYVTYRALNEETTIPNAKQAAAGFYNNFLKSLGLMANTEKQTQAKGE